MENNPLNPPYQGEVTAPSPVKGRDGEGFPASPNQDKEGQSVAFLPYNKNLTQLARENRKNPTAAERLIWNKVLCSRQFQQYKFLRQKPIGGYIVDFYCSELQLVIEIDGESHAQQVDYDLERTRFLNGHGLTVIRYTNNEVLQNVSGIFDDLCGFLLSTHQSRIDSPHAKP